MKAETINRIVTNYNSCNHSNQTVIGKYTYKIVGLDILRCLTSEINSEWVNAFEERENGWKVVATYDMQVKCWKAV